MEYSRIVAIFVTFLCVTLSVWQERAKGVCVLTRSFVCHQTWCTVYRIFLIIPHLAFSVAPGQRARGTHGCQCGPWRLVEPVAVSVALGTRWDNPKLLAWPMALVGPVADRVAHGCQWDHLWLLAWPTVVGVA